MMRIPHRSTRRRLFAILGAASLLLACVAPAQAFPTGRHPKHAVSWIAFASDRDSLNVSTPEEVTNDDIYLLEPRTGRTVRITSDPAVDQSPLISQDGRTVIFESNRSTKDYPNPDGQYAFFRCRLDLRRFVPSCRHVERVAESVPPGYYQYSALTPDGRSLVYAKGDLFVAPLNGRHDPVQLTRRPADSPGIVQPDVAPDGRTVAYNFFGNLWQVDIDGSNPTQLTNRGPEGLWVNSGPDYSPDGSQIAFHSNRLDRSDFDLWVMAAAPEGPGNQPVDLTIDVSGPGGVRPSQERFPSWSPDGRQLAFFWHYALPSTGVAAGFNEGEIYVVNAHGTRVRNLTHNYRVELEPTDDRQIGDIEPDWGRLSR